MAYFPAKPCERHVDVCAKKGMVPLRGARFTWKQHNIGPFLPFFSDECNKQEVFALSKNAARYNMKDFMMTTFFSHEKHASRRLLKRSNPPFFRQMLHIASTVVGEYLPTRSVYRYTPLFFKKFAVCMITVAWKLAQSEHMPLSCALLRN
jgi:hypothetical protein